MRAAQVLHQLLAPCWDVLDARLVRRLLGAVEALVASRQLVLMELARQFPGALRVAAPLKALDRLLSNPRVQRLRAALYATALAGFWPVTRAVVVVDWCTLTRDESLHLLRAALPVGGRTLPVWDEVHPQAKLGNAKVHLQFLATLRRLLPIETVPILITDAGFGVPWFRDAQSLGFACIGRLRGRIQLRPVGQTDWAPVCAFGELGVGRVIDLGLCEVSRRHAHRARVVVYKNPPQDRKHRDAKGRPVRGGRSRAQAQAAREPWVLVVSPALGHLSTREIIEHYRRRMQIEESFRDLKSPRYGAALRHSLTRVAARMEVLLLLHALASVAAWLRAVIGRRDRDHERLLAHGQAKRRQRPTLSLWRIGWELLKRGWPPARPWTEPPDAPPLRLEVLG
jgi:hypothetical protein